jgi:beta-N-acetylhexosaminidase
VKASAWKEQASIKFAAKKTWRRSKQNGVSFVLNLSCVIKEKMRFIRFLLLFVFLISITPVSAQTATPPAAVRLVLDAMTPEEKVGQLFLVSFDGTDASAESQIADLITRYSVGGVVLTASNNNFSTENTLVQTQTLINDLQRVKWDYSLGNATYTPLFVAIAQEGDGYPTDQILNGMTLLPSEMAIGATWDTAFAEQVAEVRGRELAALGFNLYLGPSLDVLESPSPAGGDLGTRVFGGDPFWVGEMGRAYVKGLHEGSNNNLLVIAKHFPGVGGANRLPEDEVSTVRKSLEQLKQIEFAPFFAVINQTAFPDNVADGFLVSHIRYQGFQGNIRATTRPISFDPQALNQIIALPEFATWYNEGGLLVSDHLGAVSVRDFYASGGGQFSARIAARDAFLAGNDVLYLGNIKDDAPDSYTTTIRVLDFFAQKYREDSAFAQRVDASVARILTAKLGVYDNFILANVITPEINLADFGNDSELTFLVAQNAATLISPDVQDLTSVLPQPPQPADRLVFITDALNVKQCLDCPSQPQLSAEALEEAVLKLYGPQAGNQVEEFRLSSYTFENLQALLNAPDENLFFVDDLDVADWIVISVTDASNNQPALISRFLRERPELFLNKNVILFSFGAPYYFDTTTLSKFTAYYALYSKQPQFVDVAVRLLFQELAPLGASPVSVSAVDYDLISVMSPSANQIIPLFLDLEPAAVLDESITPEATPIPLFQIGDTIAIRTGVIEDHNGRAVPDGTVVQFSMVLTGEGGGILQQVESITTQGIARASFGLDRPGLLEIRVMSEPAVISELLQLDVSQSGAVAVTVVIPELTQPIASTPEAEIVQNQNAYVSPEGYPRFSAWLISMLMTLLIAGFVFVFSSQFAERFYAIRWSLAVLIGGLLAYNLLSFGVFGKDWLITAGISGVMMITLLGQVFGFAGGWLWASPKK